MVWCLHFDWIRQPFKPLSTLNPLSNPVGDQLLRRNTRPRCPENGGFGDRSVGMDDLRMISYVSGILAELLVAGTRLFVLKDRAGRKPDSLLVVRAARPGPLLPSSSAFALQPRLIKHFTR